MVSNSILVSLRDALGLLEDDNSFDTELCFHANAALAIIEQGANIPMTKVSDETTTWDDISTDVMTISYIEDYLYMYVRIAFDPPMSNVQSYMEKRTEELLWRLMVIDEETQYQTELSNEETQEKNKPPFPWWWY